MFLWSFFANTPNIMHYRINIFIFLSMKYSSLFSQLSLSLKNRDNSLCSSNLQKIRAWFTLVELIVVITILAILALVAFLMMSDATVSARDSNRLASIKNIYDASQLQAVQQRLLPLPDQAITLTVSGTDIGWQWYMSGYVAQAYGYSDSVYDPRDNTPYIYRVNQARNKSQYLAYLENGWEVTQGDLLLAFGGMDGIERIGWVKESKSFAWLGWLEWFWIDTAQATDFSKRVPYVYGDRLGVVLSNTTNEGANVALWSGGILDLGGGSIDSNYSVYVNEWLKLASVEWTGAVALKTNGGLDQVIANATIVGSSGSNSGSGSSACGLTQGEVDAMNIPFEVVNGYTMNDTEWCALTDLNITSQPVNSTALWGIMKLINLNQLYLEATGINNVPNEIGNLVNLTWLNLADNNITSLPNGIGNLTNLEGLILTWNTNLSILPDTIDNLENIYRLDLLDTDLGNLMADFEAWINQSAYEPNITTTGQEVYIRASWDPTIQIIVWAIPLPDPGSCGITGEEIVELNSHGFRDIPSEGLGNILNLLWEDWCALTTLDISWYSLETIPTGILKLWNLEKLNISNNNFLGFPSEILALTSLTHLYAYNNWFVSIPNNISDLTQLTFLGLSDNALTWIPDNIWSLSQLVRLEIWRNQIANLPTTLWNLSNLQDLFAEYNLLTSLPSNIGSMSSLYQLYVPHNEIESLPTSIWDLSNLTYLSIQNNQIDAIPSTIDWCISLVLLRADNNLLAGLPAEIGNLSSLYILNLANNQLANLPDNFWGLHGQLVELTLSGNSALGNLNRDMSDVTSGMQVGTFVQSNITPTGGTITLHLPNIDRLIDITVTP